MASVSAPSGRELELIDEAEDPNPFATNGPYSFGKNWVPAQVTPRLKRMWLRELDRDALGILEREGPVPPSELTDALQSTRRFKDSKLGTDVSNATVEEWLTYASRRRLVERPDQRGSEWRTTADGVALLQRQKTTRSALRGIPTVIPLIGGIVGIIATVSGGADALAAALNKEMDVLQTIGLFAALALFYWGCLLALSTWLVRHRRRRRIGVLEVLRSAGWVPGVELADRTGAAAADRTAP